MSGMADGRTGWTGSLAGRGILVCAVAWCCVATGAGFARAGEAEEAGEPKKPNLVLEGSRTVGPIARAFAQYYMKGNPGVKVEVTESGSGNGAKSLVERTCDIANMGRPMKDKEWRIAFEQGVRPFHHVVAMDGIAPIVHPSNPVDELSVKQLRDIYTGRIRNWKEVGGKDEPIVAISRDTSSNTYETWEKLVMDQERLLEGAEYVPSSGSVRARVRKTPRSIGPVGVSFVNESVKALRVNGVKPSVENVQNGSWPISRNLYMVTNGAPELGSHVHRFLRLADSPEGQRLIEKMGFVAITEYK